MQEFSRHHWHFTAETSMPKRKYQGMVWGRLPTQCVLNKMVLPIVFHACGGRLPLRCRACVFLLRYTERYHPPFRGKYGSRNSFA